MNFIVKQKWKLCMKPISALDELDFNMEDGKYSELADALEYWSEMFWNKTIDDEYGDNIAYLMYNMSKEMRKVES